MTGRAASLKILAIRFRSHNLESQLPLRFLRSKNRGSAHSRPREPKPEKAPPVQFRCSAARTYNKANAVCHASSVDRAPSKPLTTSNPVSSPAFLDDFEQLIRCDPGRRGLMTRVPQLPDLCPGHLTAAARDLAETGRRVAIVTGFYVPHAAPAAAETDGPPGAVLLAALLLEAGIDTVVVTDEKCWNAVLAAARASGYPGERVQAAPLDAAAWIHAWLQSESQKGLTHLVAVERVGPSHSSESLRTQTRNGHAPLDEFHARVPREFWNRCHNMRGQVIDEHTGDLHLLFEQLAEHCPHATTIGIGDGANEIGMGCIPWEHLWPRLKGDFACRIPCRIPTHWNILAGTSNWGAFALAAAVLALRGQAALLKPWTDMRHLEVLQSLVVHGPAVDGVTGRPNATVDGLDFDTYIKPWQEIQRLLELRTTPPR